MHVSLVISLNLLGAQQLAQTCQKHGVAFVGPSADALSLCGDKEKARLVASRAGLPIVPGLRFSKVLYMVPLSSKFTRPLTS